MQIDEKAKVCPVCSYEFPVQSRFFQWVAILLVVAFLLMLLL